MNLYGNHPSFSFMIASKGDKMIHQDDLLLCLSTIAKSIELWNDITKTYYWIHLYKFMNKHREIVFVGRDTCNDFLEEVPV